LVADRDELIKRLLKRAKLEGRSDDNEESIMNRLDIYEKQTFPILNFYKDRIKIIEIDGIGAINEIHKNVVKALK